MAQAHIRLARTPEVDRVISYLRVRYSLLSEAEILKLALSEKYQKEKEEAVEKDQKVREAYSHAMEEGRKVGDRLMREKGLDHKKVT